MRSLLIKSLVTILVGFVVYVVFFLFIDKSVALWAQTLEQTVWFKIGTDVSLLVNSRFWMIFIPILLIFMVIHDGLYDQTKFTKSVLYLILSFILAMELAGALKFLLARYRPDMFFRYGLYGFHFWASKHQLHSTPSGHSTRIFALLVSLSVLYKRWASAFILLAVLVGLSRIIVHAHYPSDVLFGAIIGTLTALWVRRYMKINV